RIVDAGLDKATVVIEVLAAAGNRVDQVVVRVVIAVHGGRLGLHDQASLAVVAEVGRGLGKDLGDGRGGGWTVHGLVDVRLRYTSNGAVVGEGKREAELGSADPRDSENTVVELRQDAGQRDAIARVERVARHRHGDGGPTR